MSHSTVTIEPQLQPAQRRRVRWSSWLLVILTVAVAVVAWTQTGPLDSRLVGEWTFLTTDGTGIQSFLTLTRNGTATLERVRPGPAKRTPDTGPMTWWMEGDVLVTQVIPDPVTKAHQLAADVIALLRMKKREDRSAFRLKVVHVNSSTIRVSEVTAGVPPYLEFEMTRVEDSKGF